MPTFTVTIEKFSGQFVESYSLTTLESAKKKVKEMKKKFSLISHAGHVVNYSDQYELYTNF